MADEIPRHPRAEAGAAANVSKAIMRKNFLGTDIASNLVVEVVRLIGESPDTAIGVLKIMAAEQAPVKLKRDAEALENKGKLTDAAQLRADFILPYSSEITVEFKSAMQNALYGGPAINVKAEGRRNVPSDLQCRMDGGIAADMIDTILAETGITLAGTDLNNPQAAAALTGALATAFAKHVHLKPTYLNSRMPAVEAPEHALLLGDTPNLSLDPLLDAIRQKLKESPRVAIAFLRDIKNWNDLTLDAASPALREIAGSAQRRSHDELTHMKNVGEMALGRINAVLERAQKPTLTATDLNETKTASRLLGNLKTALQVEQSSQAGFLS